MATCLVDSYIFVILSADIHTKMRKLFYGIQLPSFYFRDQIVFDGIDDFTCGEVLSIQPIVSGLKMATDSTSHHKKMRKDP